jgi:hypothetical protein
VIILDRVFTHNGDVATFYFTIVAIDTRAGKNNQPIYCDPTIHNTAMP